MLRSFTIAAALAAAPLSAMAEPWTLDKSHTIVSFEVDHFGFSSTRGVFRNIDAEIDFDPRDISATEVSVTIDAASLDTFFEARDEHVRGADFLNVEEFPVITFVSTGVTRTSDTTATLTGDMTIRGVTRPVSFDATLNKLAPNPFAPDQQVAGFTLTGTIDRTDFGIDYGVPAIGAELPVTIDLEIGAPADAS